ncbi:MAG: RNA polymerase-binding protein RpbA [Culicoidibacterales bacterium]
MIKIGEDEGLSVIARKAWAFVIDERTKTMLQSVSPEIRFSYYKELDTLVIKHYNEIRKYDSDYPQSKEYWFLDAAFAALKEFTNQ